MLNKNLRFYLLLIYWLVLYTLTSMPGYSLPQGIKISDKIEHLLAYALFGVLFNLYFWEKITALAKKKYFTLTIILGGIYAALDEVHQLFIPMRSGEILDWLADMVGILIALILINYLLKRKKELKDNKIVRKFS